MFGPFPIALDKLDRADPGRRARRFEEFREQTDPRFPQVLKFRQGIEARGQFRKIEQQAGQGFGQVAPGVVSHHARRRPANGGAPVLRSLE